MMSNKINISLPEEVKIILNRIMQEGGQAYVVGGAVRDALLGRPVNDWDVATSLHPDESKGYFRLPAPFPLGKNTAR